MSVKEFKKIDEDNIIVDGVKYTTFENMSCNGCAFEGLDNEFKCCLIGPCLRNGVGISWKQIEFERVVTFPIDKDEELVTATQMNDKVTVHIRKKQPSKEEKELLLKDLCARLPYGIFVHDENAEDHTLTYTIDYHPKLGELKPYLRPMSAMTLEEMSELMVELRVCKKEIQNCGHTETYGYTLVFQEWEKKTFFIPSEAIDWLDAHYFDYRGLIEKGLAIKAPDDMYKIS